MAKIVKQKLFAVMIVAAAVVILGFALLVALRVWGLIRPFSVPTVGMSPEINPGDKFMMERLTYLAGKPQRGDVIVFRTDEIASIQEHAIYVKRLVGLPGDELRLSKGTLYVNGRPAALHNRNGEIHYSVVMFGRYLADDAETVKVPDGHYFVLGDNSDHSADSRLWGFLPAKSVLGRAVFCYWPPARVGSIR